MRYVIPLLVLGCGHKAPKDTKIVGWHVENADSGFACYYPVDFSVLGEGERIAARAQALDEIKGQWLGKRGDGIEMDAGRVDDVETVLLGSPEKIENVVKQNLAACQKVAGGSDAKEWESWVSSLPGTLTKGECMAHFDVQMFDYLEIGSGWQREVNVCAGDKVIITATEKDYYKITDDGAWLNAEGDKDQPTIGGDWPCTVEGCFAGMFIMKFTTEDGVEEIHPVGLRYDFEAPSNGTISYRINDNSFYDNKYRQVGSLIDKTAIQIAAAE